ncbi:MAG: valine--tRNA ligase [bacterium]|nr:valine--tRNA ligase [bacterium]
MKELDKKPDFKAIEAKWQQTWEKDGIFKFDPKSKKPVYSIDTPPPTISGQLHLGHAFSYSQTEFIARYRRMAGFNVFYPFGFDNNGLPTERLTEKKMKVKAHKMDRDEFIKLCLQVTKEHEKEYEKVWRTLGISCDWDQLYTTIEPNAQKISQLSFLRLFKKDRIYQHEAPTVWCPECQTAIAQVELEDKELTSVFNDIIFKLDDGSDLIIATTRPELLPSCVSIFVHPDDEKNKKLVGRKAKVPLFNQEVTIIADERVDPEKGSGVVMCCTFGDLTDIEWYKAHKLEVRIAIDEQGIMTDISGKYKGLKVKDARKQIIEDLKAENLLTAQKPISHMVNVHERCGVEIEFLMTKQWFVKYLDLKDNFIKAGKDMKWYPAHMRVRYDNWITGLQWDWCISRQRYYGIPFPVWYCKKCSNVITPDEKDLPVDPLKDKPTKQCSCGCKDLIPEKDVLDTWATSALTPLINGRWESKEDRTDIIYPMTLRSNAHDIITFWDFNTVVMGLFHKSKPPFADMMISGHCLDKNGKKMSKKKGNVVFPLEVVEKFSADALRWWAAGVKLGEDLWYKEEDVTKGIRLSIKLWNVARFLAINLDKKPKKTKLTLTDQWILHELNEVVKESTKYFNEYEYSKARFAAEVFFWNSFCDNYLELIKYRLYNDIDKESAQYTIYVALQSILKLFAPIMPFITEELYTTLFSELEKEKSIHTSSWPKYEKDFVSEEASEIGKAAVIALSEMRKWKKLKNISFGAEVEKLKLTTPDKEKLDKINKDLAATMKAKDLEIIKGEEISVC